MAREELMIRPRREVAGVVACEVAEELGRVVPAEDLELVVPAVVVVCEGAAEELELVVPARTTALMSPP